MQIIIASPNLKLKLRYYLYRIIILLLPLRICAARNRLDEYNNNNT
jgi:hypothetical protein